MLPKKKSRKIVVQNQIYFWRTQYNLKFEAESLINFEKIKKNTIDKNPELKNKSFGIILNNDELNYSHETKLIIQNRELLIQAYFDDKEILGSIAKWSNLVILPNIVHKVILFVLENKMNNLKKVQIPNAEIIFKEALLKSEEKRIHEANENYKLFQLSQSETYFLSAKQNIHKKDYIKAIDDLNKSIFNDKENPYKFQLLQNIINKSNESAQLYNHRASLYRKFVTYYKMLENYELALSDIEKAIELQPNFAIAYGTWAEILYDKGDLEGFYEKLKIAIQKGMSEKIDSNIEYFIKNDERYLEIIKHK